jgi:replicative DNA helicase
MSDIENIKSVKLPPHSIEAEQAVLSALMQDGYRWDVVAEILRADQFYRKEHRILFAAMAEQVAKSCPIDAVTISAALRNSNKLADAGGIEYIMELVQAGQSAANIRAYAGIVAERALLRHMISVAHGIADSAYSPDGRTAAELLALAGSSLATVETTGDGDEPQQIDIALKESVNALEYRFENQGQLHGLSTGFKDVDELLLGLADGDLFILGGRPAAGKTTLAMNIAENVALSGKSVIVFSLEMSRRKLMDRMLCSVGRIDAKKYRKGEVVNEDWDKLSMAVSKLRQRHMYIDDNSMLSSTQLLGRSRRIARQVGQKPALIVIDYLQLMNDKGDGVERVTKISKNFKQLAREMNCPVIALSQLNRKLEERADKRPIMSDLRDSGSIEQDADVIGFVYREEVYDENTQYKGIAELIIGKNRDGEIGKVMLSAALHRNKFEDISPGWSAPVIQMPATRKGGFQYGRGGNDA